jgi:hypothetical protein
VLRAAADVSVFAVVRYRHEINRTGNQDQGLHKLSVVLAGIYSLTLVL